MTEPSASSNITLAPLWWNHVSDGQIHFRLDPKERPRLTGALEYDIAIVGGGYTGLWSAYWLKKANPNLSIAIVEAEHVGFGASGRNAGWMSGAFDGRPEILAAESSKAAVIQQQQLFQAAVDEALLVLKNEGIDADAVKDGCIRVARSEAQAARLRSSVESEREWGMSEYDLRLLDKGELESRVIIAGVKTAAFTPHCARVHPAKLVHGLADVCERLGVVIYEGSKVHTLLPHRIATTGGSIQAKFIIRATEGYTSRLPHLARRWLPMNSSMISTEPLPQQIWDEVRWQGAETISDQAHSYVYLQRSADNRILLGGRGIPYRYANSFNMNGLVPQSTTASLIAMLHQMFPAVRQFQVTNSWSGILGVPRDFSPGVSLDRTTGMAWAGGYVGQGVLASYVAGRTLADLITGVDTERVHLPWVNHSVRQWEPEPLRWCGVRSMYLAYRKADRIEAKRGTEQTSVIASIANRITGR